MLFGVKYYPFISGALDIKAISRELDMVRAEQDDLQRTSQHLREEIAILNENIGKKDLEIRQKDAAYEYLLGRNAILLEQTETNERLVSSLRVSLVEYLKDELPFSKNAFKMIRRLLMYDIKEV